MTLRMNREREGLKEMFPPVDDSVLQKNPDFASLYNTLTQAALNRDGTTKNDPAAQDQAAVREELRHYRLEAAKHHLLTHAIASATPPEPSRAKPSARSGGREATKSLQHDVAEPSESLLNLLFVLPPILETGNTLSEDSVSLLFSNPPLSELDQLLPELTTLVSSNLHMSALGLARITQPSTNPSYVHRHVSALPQSLSSIRADVASAQETLLTSRLDTLSSLVNLLQTYTQSITHLIRALEAKHGVVARNLELRASEVSVQAQRSELDAEQALWDLRREIYTPEMIVALKAYTSHLRDAKVRGEERLRTLGAELAEYGVGVEGGEAKERKMREMARVYREMTRREADTKGDLDRLRGG